jgi:hypothetical protein
MRLSVFEREPDREGQINREKYITRMCLCVCICVSERERERERDRERDREREREREFNKIY